MSDTIKVGFGDAGYTSLRAKWITEGRPNGTFEELGDFGGRQWKVRTSATEDYPDYYLKAAAGPTDPGYDKDPEYWDWADQTSGYLIEMKDTGLEITQGKDENDPVFKMEPFPLDEGVWSP